MAGINKFIERSMRGVLSFLKESVFSDEYALQKGFLQALNPMIKIVIFLLFILQVLFAMDILILFYLYMLCLILAMASGINFWFFLKRTWIFIPLFSFFIAIPAMFSVFTPGEALATFNIIGLKLIITRQGLYGAGFFVMRVITSVSFVVLLSVTTRHFELLRTLQAFRMPTVFVMTLGMCYRYIYLSIEMVEHIYLAIKSRAGTSIHYKKGQRIVAWNITCLWQRSRQLNEEVYSAMLSRGYTGEPVVLNDFKIKSRDWAWLLSAALLSAAIFYVNHLTKG